MGKASHHSDAPKAPLLKRAARGVARAVYRIVLPFLRPLAFRTRRYLTQHIQDELNRTSALALTLQADLRQVQLELTHEIRHSQAAGTDILLWTAQGVQHEVVTNARHLHEVAEAQGQQSVAGIHQAIQHARESIKEEIFRTVGPHEQNLRAVIADTQSVLDTTNKSLDIVRNTANINDARLERIENYAYAAARRVAVHCDHGIVLIRTSVGYVLCDDADHAVLANLIDTGELEPGTRLLIERFIQPGDVFVDVGANLGMISLAAARAMRGKGKIFTFEPFPPTKRLLEKTFWLNGLSAMLESHGAAVSSREGSTRLFLGATSGHHSIFPFDPTDVEGGQFVDVPLVTLDGALPPQQEVTLLKIDAEGAEIDVVRGALNILANNADIALIVEFGASHLRRVGHSPARWFSVFEQHGFEYRAIHPETGALEKWTHEQLVSVDSVNVFFARPNSRAWIRLGDAQ